MPDHIADPRKLDLGKLPEMSRVLDLLTAMRMPESLPGETDAQYTDRLTGADKTGRRPYAEHRLRQCSIGYHDECSDPTGEICECPCHKLTSELWEAALRELLAYAAEQQARAEKAEHDCAQFAGDNEQLRKRVAELEARSEKAETALDGYTELSIRMHGRAEAAEEEAHSTQVLFHQALANFTESVERNAALKARAEKAETLQELTRQQANAWADVVHECERILECPDRSIGAEQANLPNLIRDQLIERRRAENRLHEVNAENVRLTTAVDMRLSDNAHLAARVAELEAMVRAASGVDENETTVCRRCEGNGALYADGKAHYHSEHAPTMPCPECGGIGRIQPDAKAILEGIGEVLRAFAPDLFEEDDNV